MYISNLIHLKITKFTNSAYKYTHFFPAGNHPGTQQVTQSVNKPHSYIDRFIAEMCRIKMKKKNEL